MSDEFEPWTRLAACLGSEPALFFPARYEDAAPARAICRRCEVRADCLAYALRHRIVPGVWGGKSERQRQRMRNPR